MIDPDFDPLKLLEELAHEVVRLNQRQQQVEKFLREMAEQNANIAEHLAGQSQEIYDIYKTLGKLQFETQQSTSTDSQGPTQI